jgi:hypothetical protein
MELYFHSPISLHGMVLNSAMDKSSWGSGYLSTGANLLHVVLCGVERLNYEECETEQLWPILRYCLSIYLAGVRKSTINVNKESH